MTLKLLILGVNGFIGSNLSRYIMDNREWEIYGMDIDSTKIKDLLDNPRFHFVEGDITINKEWIEYHTKKCDVILPLVAIATPATYVRDPISVFELDFEANLDIIRHCVKYNKRVLFPSTSEVYGMSEDTVYNEETTPLVTGPIHKERWIYSSCKQLMDRIIYAYGSRGQLSYTLFRPFNWFGPGLDDVWAQKEGSSRVITQFLSAILHRNDIHLVDGGAQKRCFLYVDDAMEAMIKIIENRQGCAEGKIINIGNPSNEASIEELAHLMIDIVKEYPEYANVQNFTKLNVVEGKTYYGKGYQDLQTRVPCINNARNYLNWQPSTNLRDGLKQMIDFYITQPTGSHNTIHEIPSGEEQRPTTPQMVRPVSQSA